MRYSRDTYLIVEDVNEFTISVLLDKDLKKELTYCSSKSGRNYDKIKECNLKLIAERVINNPILRDCDMHYKCKGIYKQALEPRNVIESVKTGTTLQIIIM